MWGQTALPGGNNVHHKVLYFLHVQTNTVAFQSVTKRFSIIREWQTWSHGKHNQHYYLQDRLKSENTHAFDSQNADEWFKGGNKLALPRQLSSKYRIKYIKNYWVPTRQRRQNRLSKESKAALRLLYRHMPLSGLVSTELFTSGPLFSVYFSFSDLYRSWTFKKKEITVQCSHAYKYTGTYFEGW